MASTFAYANSKTPYIDMYNDYRKEQQGIRDAYRKQLETDRTAAETSSNAEYDNAARQNYINYMQARKRLPSELNALGIRGGASESSALRLGTNYGSNVASNEAARNTALANLRQSYEDRLAQYDEEWDNKLQQAYLTAIENQLNWELAQKQASGSGGGGGRSYGGYGSSGGSAVDTATATRSANDLTKALGSVASGVGSVIANSKGTKRAKTASNAKKANAATKAFNSRNIWANRWSK